MDFALATTPPVFLCKNVLLLIEQRPGISRTTRMGVHAESSHLHSDFPFVWWSIEFGLMAVFISVQSTGNTCLKETT